MNNERAGGFESWMVSNVAAGAATLSFVVLLIPPFITQVTGSAIRAGIVLAVIGLAALAGPYIGRFADRHQNHRIIYIASMFGMALGFAFLALDANVSIYSPLVGILLGVCMAAQGTIGPAFIVGAGQSPRTVARQLTVYSVLLPAGQVVGAAAVGLGQLANFSAPQLFWLASAVMGVFAFWTWAGVGKPAQRLRVSRRVAASNQKSKTKVSRRAVYLSTFGLFMLIATIGAIANNGMMSQVANILPAVYGFSAAQTSGIIGIAGLLSMGAIIFSGWWMQKRGSFPVYAGGSTVKWIGMLAMALVGVLAGPHLLLAALAVQIAYIGPLLTRTAAPNMSSLMAPVQAAEANGYYFATAALGAFLGSLMAGFIAQHVSFQALNWTNAILSGLAVALLFVFLLPKARAFTGLFTSKTPGGEKGS